MFVSLPRLVLGLVFYLAISLGAWGQALPKKGAKPAAGAAKTVTKPVKASITLGFKKPTKKKPTTKPKAKPNLSKADSSGLLRADSVAIADTIKGKDSVRVSNDLSTTVTYQAEDSIVFWAKTRIARLYGNADITYGDINLKAQEVKVDYQTNLVDARGKKDSTGKWAGSPIFTQGGEKFQADSMQYNFKTRKGLIRQVITQQGDGYIHGEAVKRESETSLYIRNAEYTTCNLAHPHFYIKSYKMKMVPGKKIVSGPFLMHIADVPTPLGFIFGFFPIPKYKSSGIIIPTYGESAQQGFFLRGGGVYLALSDYFDLKLLGEIYTLGGWGFTPQSSYKKRYAYDGSVNLRYNSRPALETDASGAPTGRRIQNASREIWVSWSHTPVSTGNSRFSASVQAGTNQSNSTYSYNLTQRFTTNFASNVNYSTSLFNNLVSVSASARLDQQIQTKSFRLDLPTLAVTVARIFPFKKPGAKANALTNLSFSYSFTSQYSINSQGGGSLGLQGQGVRQVPVVPTPDGTPSSIPLNRDNLPLLLKNAKFGARHTIPISTTFRLAKYFNVSPSFTFNETWYASKLKYNYDSSLKGVHVDTVAGFNRFYDFSTAASVSTQIYGTVFIKKGKWEAIRHRITPNIGFSYRPDFGTQAFGFFQKTKVDSTGKTLNLNPYTNYLYGGPSSGGRSAAITFGLQNVIEAKFRTISDSGRVKYSKKNIIENFGVSGNYNLLADSFNLSTLNFQLNTRLLNKINVASSWTLDPYAYGDRHIAGASEQRNKVRTHPLAITSGQGLGTITSANLSFGYNFNPAAKKKKELPKRTLSEAEKQELSFINANPNLFVDFTIPWSLNMQYNVQYQYIAYGSKTYAINQYMQVSGDVSLAPKWKLGYSAPFDFQNKKFASTSLSINRDLHCWEMAMSLILAGTRPSYQFRINVKASILQDLKLSKQNNFYDR